MYSTIRGQLTRHYKYDDVGNCIESKDRNGRIRKFKYDPKDRLIEETWVDGNCLITYDYNGAGQLQGASDRDSQYDYDYDDNGRLESVDNTGTSGVPDIKLTYGYDNADNLTTVTDTLGGVESFTYDRLNRVESISQGGSAIALRVELSYDAASQIDTIERFNTTTGGTSALTSDYDFDSNGRLTNLSHASGADYTFDYDEVNRLVSWTTPDGTGSFDYDDTDQLTRADYDYQSDEDYNYDRNGNRTNPGYTTGDDNRLLSGGVYEYKYDDEGNRIERKAIATGDITTYTWDFRNRLTRVETVDTSGEVLSWAEYTYDAFDRRIRKSYDLDGIGSIPANSESFVYDGDHIYLVFNDSGLLKERYLHGEAIDQVLAQESNGQVYWTLGDHQGSLRYWVDTNGDVVLHLVYDSFGNITQQSDPEFEFRFGYTGREHDAETGLMYYRARYYNPRVGRFVSLDPIGFDSGDVNLYRYVFNNPLTHVDPSGNIPQWLYDFSDWVEDNVHRPVGEVLARHDTSYPLWDWASISTPDWERAERFFSSVANNVADFTEGFSYQTLYNNGGDIGVETRRALDPEFDRDLTRLEAQATDAFRYGQATADVVGIWQGFQEIVSGGSLVIGGTAGTATSGGTASPVTVPVKVAGVALIAHGVKVIVTSSGDLIEQIHYLAASERSDGGSDFSQAGNSGDATGGNTSTRNLGSDFDNLEIELRSDPDLVAELSQSGVKFDAEDIVRIGRNQEGKIVFLEIGVTAAEAKAKNRRDASGLKHILDPTKVDSFKRRGISVDRIPDAVFNAATQGRLVATQGRSRGIFEVVLNGKKEYISVEVANNGYIVGANPTSSITIEKLRKQGLIE